MHKGFLVPTLEGLRFVMPSHRPFITQRMKTSIARNLLSLANARAFLAGAALLTGANLSAQSTNLVSSTTFDAEAGVPWSYGYYYGDPNGLGLYELQHSYYDLNDFDLTNGYYRFAFDLASLTGTVGYGTGTGAPLFGASSDPSAYVSGDRGNYIFTFDARVEGLEPDQTGNGEMQVQFYLPPLPDQTEARKILHVNLPFAPTAEWQTFSFTLDQGALSGDSNEPSFETNHTSIVDTRFNVNFHEPHTRFGYDSDNVLYVDNVNLEVVDKPVVPPVETFPVTMAEWNFDDKPAWYQYNYGWVAEGGEPLIVTADNNPNGTVPNELGKDGTSGWFLNVDNSAYAFGAPAWAGAGTGGAGPIDVSLLDSPELADYRVTFDARVQGLAPERTTGTSALLQLFADTPDDTVQPADANTDGDAVVQLNFPIAAVNTDWQTYSFLFSKGSVGGGSEELFAQHLAAITGFRTQWQIENATSLNDWGYDAENTLIIDNFKLERMYPVDGTGPQLNAAYDNGQLVLTWNTPPDATITLQSSATVDGEYTEVVGATSGHTVDTTATARFFRLVQE